MKKVLFICTGNTCRSPMAMFLFRKHIKNNKNLPFRKYFWIPASYNLMIFVFLFELKTIKTDI